MEDTYAPKTPRKPFKVCNEHKRRPCPKDARCRQEFLHFSSGREKLDFLLGLVEEFPDTWLSHIDVATFQGFADAGGLEAHERRIVLDIQKAAMKPPQAISSVVLAIDPDIEAVHDAIA